MKTINIHIINIPVIEVIDYLENRYEVLPGIESNSLRVEADYNDIKKYLNEKFNFETSNNSIFIYNKKNS